MDSSRALIFHPARSSLNKSINITKTVILEFKAEIEALDLMTLEIFPT